MREIAVLVVERERAVAQAIARRLEAEPDLAVVGTAHTAHGAIAAAEREQPDVIVLDEGVAGDLSDVLVRLVAEAPDARRRRVVVTSDGSDVRRAYVSIRAGASAYVDRSAGADEMVRTITSVAAGETRIPPRLLSGVLDEFRCRVPEPGCTAPAFPQLTIREREVLECLSAGLDRIRIARRLGLSVHTVRTHTQHLFAKLEVHSSVEAASVAARNGLLGSAGHA